jgi:two-component system sensor histidine kinase YesM
MISYVVDKRYKWKIVSIIPAKELSNETAAPGLIGFAIILINSLLMFIGTILTSRIITIPIKKLLKSMKGVQNGEFREVDIRAGSNEIGQLRDGYNMMIKNTATHSPCNHRAKIRESRIKTCFRLRSNPIFFTILWIDQFLILMEENRSGCNVVDALGSVYRLSLSKGKEIITIGEEIEMVKNYLNIQKVRFADLFSVCYNLDERAGSYKILNYFSAIG